MTTTNLAFGIDWHLPCDVANSEVPGTEELLRTCTRLREELAELEGVVSAAVLAATVFRLRDEAGLIDAMRGLTEAVAGLERRRPAE
ncbi:hypothetical protein SH611_14375 [Geminicoccaceae bacterium 1502E]|nr:hypothetical protein [Geminicoccaceae bacterium 1502E]